MKAKKTNKTIKDRLEYLRREIRAEQISYGEIAELESLASYIEEGDVELRGWADIPERDANEIALDAIDDK